MGMMHKQPFVLDSGNPQIQSIQLKMYLVNLVITQITYQNKMCKQSVQKYQKQYLMKKIKELEYENLCLKETIEILQDDKLRKRLLSVKKDNRKNITLKDKINSINRLNLIRR